MVTSLGASWLYPASNKYMMYDAGDINDIWAGIQAGSTSTSLATWTSTGWKDLT